MTSVIIAGALRVGRQRVSSQMHLPLVLVGLLFNGVGLVACQPTTATMAAFMLPAILWANHFLPGVSHRRAAPRTRSITASASSIASDPEPNQAT